MRIHRVRLPIVLVAVTVLGFAETSWARQDAPRMPTQTPQSGRRIGIDLFGGAGITWAAAVESFEAVGLERTAAEFGGGARVTGIWRDLFLQTSVSRWSDTGERAFIDSTGERFPLGIPLHLKATYVDVSVGWKVPTFTASGRTALWSYVGGGAGLANYSEDSPFAADGDDFDTSSASYHVFAGVEVPVVSVLAVAFDARYRFVPGVLGEDGVSAVRDEDVLGGFQMSAGLRVGFGGGTRSRPSPPAATPRSSAPPAKDLPSVLPPQRRDLEAGVIVESAPVFLYPDPQRTPLKTLTAGTIVRILEETPEWVRIEFTDNFGVRVGYVQRKFVRRQ